MNPIKFPSQKALQNIQRAIPKMKSPSEALAFYYWVPEQTELTSLKNPQAKPVLRIVPKSFSPTNSVFFRGYLESSTIDRIDKRRQNADSGVKNP